MNIIFYDAAYKCYLHNNVIVKDLNLLISQLLTKYGTIEIKQIEG